MDKAQHYDKEQHLRLQLESLINLDKKRTNLLEIAQKKFLPTGTLKNKEKKKFVNNMIAGTSNGLRALIDFGKPNNNSSNVEAELDQAWRIQPYYTNR